MDKLNPLLLAADLIAFISPVYCWGLPAQLKAVIDRFQVTVFAMQGKKKALLMTTSASAEAWVTDPAEAHFNAMLRFMKWEDAGRILARGCAVRADIKGTNYPELACAAGKGLR